MHTYENILNTLWKNVHKTINSVAVWGNYVFILKTYFTVNFDFTSKMFVWLDVFCEINHPLHLTFLSFLYSLLFVVFLQTFWKNVQETSLLCLITPLQRLFICAILTIFTSLKKFFEEKQLRRKNFPKTFLENGKNKMYTTRIAQVLSVILILR